MPIGKKEIAEQIAEKLSIPAHSAKHMLEKLISIILKKAESPDGAQIQNFGSFAFVSKRQRRGRNPRTNTEVSVSARRILSFSPSKTLRDEITNRFKNKIDQQ